MFGMVWLLFDDRKNDRNMLNIKDRDTDKYKNMFTKICLQKFISEFMYFQNSTSKDNISTKKVFFTFYY